MRKNGIGSHELPNQGKNNDWLTPEPIIRALGVFDLDPCAAPSPRPWATAAHYIELPEDGLTTQWNGRVWLNPPYGQETKKWLARMAEHRWGIALIFARTDTTTWSKWVWPYAHSILFLDGRIAFHTPDGLRGKARAGAPSVLIAYSGQDTEALRCAKLKGALVTSWEHPCQR